MNRQIFYELINENESVISIHPIEISYIVQCSQLKDIISDSSVALELSYLSKGF